MRSRWWGGFVCVVGLACGRTAGPRVENAAAAPSASLSAAPVGSEVVAKPMASVAPLALDTSVSFSKVLRSDDVSPTITVLAKETVLHSGALVLRVSNDTIVQDAEDLRGIDLVLTRPAAAFTGISGPSFREAFLEITPGARRFGATLVYRPAAKSGAFAGFRAVNYAHENAEGYGFRVGPKGSIWGVSIHPVEGEQFLTHLAGPEIWPPKDPPELGDDPFKRRVEARDGTKFIVGTSGGKDVVLRRKEGEANGTITPLPPLPEIIKTVGFTFDAHHADLAFLFAFVPELGPDKPAQGLLLAWDGKAWTEEPTPAGHVLSSFCVRADGTRWGVADPKGRLRPPPATVDKRLVRRTPTGAWQQVPLPAGITPSSVSCDDPRDVWVTAADADDHDRGAVLMRSRPLANGVVPEVSLVDWPRDGDVRKDIEPEPIEVSSFSPQPATSVCPTKQLWALLAQEGSRIPPNWDEEPAKTPAQKAERKKARDEKKRAGTARLKPLIAGTTLPEGAQLELIGKPGKRWIGTLVPSYEAGRKLVDAAIVRFPQERPKLLCAIPDKRAPYQP